MLLAAIAVSGALGALARYALTQVYLFIPLPWATLGVNVLGSGLIGATYLALQKVQDPSQIQLLLAIQIGFLGAFTTFSTFSLDVLKEIQAGKVGLALVYFVLTPVLSVLACYLVFKCGSKLLSV